MTTHAYHLETQRGGFGSTFGPIVFGTAAAFFIIRGGSGS